jgi:hypothetical protein
MAKNSERLAHDEETDTQAIAFCGIQLGECFEDLRNLPIGDSGARVVHIDADSGTGVPAAKQDATSRFGILNCIADQIAQGGAQKQAVAQYRGAAGNHVDAYALAERSLFVLPAGLPQGLLDAYRHQIETSGAFSEAHRSQDLLQLFPEPVDRILTGSQGSQFGVRSDSQS